MSKPSLRFAIVGAGLGGLAAAIALRRGGHSVVMLEQSSKFGHIGAGIQIPPNSSRILRTWGLIPEIAKHSVQPSELRFRSWKSGHLLYSAPFSSHKATYGESTYFLHRADFHAILVEEARGQGVDIQLGATVQNIEFEQGKIELLGREEVNADIIVGADGMNSICRELLLGRKDPPTPTGDLAYRLTVKESAMRTHPMLQELLDDIPNDVWIGPGTFVVGYLLKQGGYYNIVVVCPDTMPKDINVAQATPQEMRELLRGWDERLQALLGIVEETAKWRMLTSREMPEWRHPTGNFVLLGDACHATPPYLGQGAAIAVEDGAALGALFAHLTDPSQIRTFLTAFEDLRKPRTTAVVQATLQQGRTCKYPDGKEQEERDAALMTPGLEEYPMAYANRRDRDFLLGYDAVGEAERVWEWLGI